MSPHSSVSSGSPSECLDRAVFWMLEYTGSLLVNLLYHTSFLSFKIIQFGGCGQTGPRSAVP